MEQFQSKLQQERFGGAKILDGRGSRLEPQEHDKFRAGSAGLGRMSTNERSLRPLFESVRDWFVGAERASRADGLCPDQPCPLPLVGRGAYNINEVRTLTYRVVHMPSSIILRH